MNSSEKGEAFERRALLLITQALQRKMLGIDPDCCRVFHRKGYFSRDRGSEIVFDISIEVTLPNAPRPSFYWLWECKDYGGPIPVNDVEEFYAKVCQVTGLNVKAAIITPSVFQPGALEYAKSKQIGLIRVLPGDYVLDHRALLRIISPCSTQAVESTPRAFPGSTEREKAATERALLHEDHPGLHEQCFSLVYGLGFADLSTMFSAILFLHKAADERARKASNA